MIPVEHLVEIARTAEEVGFDAPLEKKKDSLKRFADTYIHSGWQR
jgi:hypothetical protein